MKTCFFWISILGLGIQLFHPALAQTELNFHQIRMSDGLSNNRILDIEQDQNGFLWVLTEKGLNRYDGYESKIFPIESNFLLEKELLLKSSLMIDSENTVWTIPGSLIPSYFDSDDEKFIPISGLRSVTAMVEAGQGQFLFGTLSGQLIHWTKETKETELILAKTDQELIQLIKNPKIPVEVVVLFKREIGVINTKTLAFQPVFSVPNSSDIQLSSMTIDQNGKFWIGTFNHGIITFDGQNELISIPHSNPLIKSFSPILELHSDSLGRLWAATYGQGVLLYEPDRQLLNQFEYQKNKTNSLPNNDVISLFQDYSGVVWIGTLGSGLSFYDPFLDKFNVLTNSEIPDKIDLHNIKAIFLDSLDKMWLGTAGNGLVAFDKNSNSWESFSTSSNTKLKEDRIESISGKGDEIWIGYQNEGLSILNSQKNTIRHFNSTSQPTLPSSQILKIFRDKSDQFWLCTRNDGIIQFDPNQGIIRQFSFGLAASPNFPDSHITDMIQSGNGEYWIATYAKGLIKLDLATGIFRQIYQEDSLQSIAKISSLFNEKDKKLWVGTANQGLKILDLKTEKWVNAPDLEKLSHSQIHGILSDRSGRIWISSDHGISYIASAENSGFQVTHYSKYGQLSHLLSPGAFHSSSTNGLFFGGVDHILHFKGEEITQNPNIPRLALTKISNGKIDYTPENGKKFKATDNNLTFHFSSLLFSSPDKNQYQYRLFGYEENWKIQEGNNWASYTNLDPGDYEFQVKGSNYDGVWNETPVIYSFQIAPPWYQSISAKIAYLLIFVILFVFIYQYLKWRWSMTYKLEITNKEAVRLKEIDQLKSAFFSNISHELRTPLTLIMGPTERLIQDCDNPVHKSQLNLIQSNAKKLLVLIDKILSIRKITAEKPVLKIRKGNLGLLIQSVLVNFYYLSTQKNLTIQSKIPLITEIWYDSDQMERVLENLIHFVIQEAEPNSHLKFESTYKNKLLSISVHYYRSSPQSRAKVHHLNPEKNPLLNESSDSALKLKLIEKLIDSHRGKLKVISEQTNESSLVLDFSVDKYSYHPSQVVEEEEWEMESIESPEIKSKLSDQAPKILIVEDNKSLRNFLIRELSNSYHIIEAADGKEGIFEAYKHIPDLILSDIMMPEVDGLALCKELKNNEKTSHIPIILLTAKIEEETQLLGLEFGADDYIQKPFSSRQLALRIEKLIELRNRLRIRYTQGSIISPKEIAVNPPDQNFLQKVQEIVDSDFLESDFSVDDFSKKLGMSRMQLHRKLTALTGLSTSAFIRDQRLRKAIQKLEKTDETISEIAYSVGFSSPSYFIKCFKENYSMTPMEYQQSKVN